MKKELLTKQDYLDAHLKEFEAMYNGEIVKGVVFVDDDKKVYLLQDSNIGATPKNKDWRKIGFKFSWCQFYGDHTTITAMENVTIEQWQPKFGEVVIAYNDEEDEIKKKHIFLFKKDNLYHCVRASYQSVDYYHRNDIHFSYDVSIFNFVKQIEEPKPIEISLEEAKEIIAKEKGIKSEQVNLNFKIN